MTTSEIISQLQAFGNENTKKTFIRHGAREPLFGVKVEDLKKIVKKLRKNHDLSIELFKTGISDAMYLAGLIADETKITKEELNSWAEEAYWYMISEYTVAGTAAKSKFGFELAKEWIASDKENIASSGWACYSNLLAIKKPDEIDLKLISSLLDKVEKEIHQSPNRVRYTMNSFIISTGAYIEKLNGKALEIAVRIGKVKVDMGETSCKVPSAKEYIQKISKRNEAKN